MSNLLNALKRRYEADIACAKANISVYVEHPVGIGEHADLVGAIDGQGDALADRGGGAVKAGADFLAKRIGREQHH